MEHFLAQRKITIDNRCSVALKSMRRIIQKMQENFIITTVDKASSNYAFTCKKQYLLFMNKEMGYDWINNKVLANNETYVIHNTTSLSTIVQEHIAQTALFFNRPANPSFNRIPTIYGIPKMHKSPIKF